VPGKASGIHDLVEAERAVSHNRIAHDLDRPPWSAMFVEAWGRGSPLAAQTITDDNGGCQ
jgi:hypothetical protein